jgi:CheY-like chemotaxis protein
MLNTASNLESLKQKIASSPQDKFFKGKLSGVGEVLIVDDEEPFVLSLADGLSSYKKYFNVRTAPNGAEAVKILKLSPIDLVITDLSMPKMDGFELLAYMSRNYPKIPVILMTAYGTPKIEEIVGNMGIFRYLEKPLDVDTVADNIIDALGIKISVVETKAPITEQIRKADIPHKESPASPISVQHSVEKEDSSKATATFGSRTSLSLADLAKMKEEARSKTGGKEKLLDKKLFTEDKKIEEAAEKRAFLEAKARAEEEKFAREEAQRKVKEAEEKARQEALARQEAERKVRETEEKARQEALAREEAIKKTKSEADEKLRQEALAREEAIKKAKAEAEAEERARKEALAHEEAERKAKETEEKARQEALAKEEAQRKAKEAEEKARQEALAKEEAQRKAKEAEEKARQEALAHEEAERKAKEAEEKTKKDAQTLEKDTKQKDLKSETKQKLSAWKKS